MTITDMKFVAGMGASGGFTFTSFFVATLPIVQWLAAAAGLAAAIYALLQKRKAK